MGDAMNQLQDSVNQAFDNTEAGARKRKKKEDSNAEASAWDTLKELGSMAAAGGKDMLTNPKGVWDDLEETRKGKK